VAPPARELPHPAADEIALTVVLAALSDPARLQIVRRLQQGPLTVAECAADVPKSTLSHQLKTLREAGVVRNTAAGRQRRIILRRHDLDTRFPGLLDAILTPSP
jgi:DNA-binding transcriptional ArsR family regulator